jgi:predicted urease superfamily metal-dependent hydrolase
MTQDNTSKPDYSEIFKRGNYLAELSKQLGAQERAALAGRYPSNNQLLDNDSMIAETIAFLMGRIDTLEKLVRELQGGAS